MTKFLVNNGLYVINVYKIIIYCYFLQSILRTDYDEESFLPFGVKLGEEKVQLQFEISLFYKWNKIKI